MISPEQEEFVGSVSLGPCFMPEIWLHNVSQLELEQLGCLQLNALNCWASFNHGPPQGPVGSRRTF